MPNFKYIAYDKKGKKETGIIEADSKEQAIVRLKQKGLYPETINLLSKSTSSEKKINLFKIKKITSKERIDIIFQLATLLDTGIPLTEALKIIAKETKNQKLRNIILSIKDKINEGTKLSIAFKDYPEFLNPMYIGMISIAEKTGNLSKILFTIAKYEEKKNEFTQKIISTAVYPLFILSIGTIVVSFLIIYVVPKMNKIFSSLNKDLPTVTKILIYTSSTLKEHIMEFLLFIIFLYLSFQIFYKKFKKFRVFIEKRLLSISLYKKILVSRFSDALVFQLKAGLPLVEAIIYASKTINNEYFHQLMEKISQNIKKGQSISKAFSQAKIFDEMFIASIATGQKSGQIEKFIERIAIYYEKKINDIIKRTLALIEPIFILILGLIVGFIVMSIMIPLFEINQLVQ